MKVGRNAPCPCGSGRKYKKCCLSHEHARSEALRLFHHLESLIYDVTRFAEDRYGPGVLDQGWLDFWDGDPPEEWDADLTYDLFHTWFAFMWIPLDRRQFNPDCRPHPGTLAAQFLETNPALEPRLQQILEASRNEPLSFWKIEGVDGERVLMRDIVLDRNRKVLVPPHLRTLIPGHFLFAQVIEVDGTSILGGHSSQSYADSICGEVIQEVGDVLRENGVQAARDLLRRDMEILRFYRQMLEVLENHEIENKDGERVVLTWSMYQFDPERRPELMRQLRSMRNFHYLGDSVDPLGSGEDGDQLALDPVLLGPLPPQREEHLKNESPGTREAESEADKLLPFPGMPAAAAESDGEEENKRRRSERVELLLDPELPGPSEHNPTFVWRTRRPKEPGNGTTLARIEVEEDSLVTVANSAERDERLGDRLARNAGHILTYVGSMERSIWEVVSQAEMKS